MSVKVIIEPARLVGIQACGPSSFNVNENSGAKFGDQLWHEFIEKVVKAEISLDRDMYGVSWPADSNVPPQQIHYFCGFISDENFEGLTELKIEGGNYFQFDCEVLAVDMDKGFQEAYMKAMPESGLKGRNGQHLEIYGEEYDPDSSVAKFKILIPVE